MKNYFGEFLRGDIAGVLLEALEPFSILGAQCLWVAQPALGVFVDRERIASWAAFLEDPSNLARLREDFLNE